MTLLFIYLVSCFINPIEDGIKNHIKKIEQDKLKKIEVVKIEKKLNIEKVIKKDEVVITIKQPLPKIINICGIIIDGYKEDHIKKIKKATDMIGCENLIGLRRIIISDRIECKTKDNSCRASATPYKGRISIKTSSMDTNYAVWTVVHELSHVFYNNLESSITNEFCNIGFGENSDINLNDFITSYAMTNCKEDFAESITEYLRNNNEFFSIAKSSDKLKKKYTFIKNNIFNGIMHNTGTHLKNTSVRREYADTEYLFPIDSF